MKIPIPAAGLFLIEKGVLNKALLRPETSDVTIPANVIAIAPGVFMENSNLRHVFINDGCRIIGEEAFAQCDNLALVRLPRSITTIGDYAFKGCRSLRQLELPGNIKPGYDAIPLSIHVIRVAGLEKMAPEVLKPLALVKSDGATLSVSLKTVKTPEHWKRKYDACDWSMLDGYKKYQHIHQMSKLVDIELTLDASSTNPATDIQNVISKLPKSLLSLKQIRVVGTDAYSQGYTKTLMQGLVSAFDLEETKASDLLLKKRRPRQERVPVANVDKWSRRSYSKEGGWSVHI